MCLFKAVISVVSFQDQERSGNGPRDFTMQASMFRGVLPLPVGSRLSHIHLLSGGILPLLSLLEITLVRNAVHLELSKETRSLRVVRVQLDDGRRLIGIRYPLPLISEVASLLKALQHAQQSGVKDL